MEYLYIFIFCAGTYVLWVLTNISIQQREQTRVITEGITSLKDGLGIHGKFGHVNSVEDIRRSVEAIKRDFFKITKEYSSFNSDLNDIRNFLEEMRIKIYQIELDKEKPLNSLDDLKHSLDLIHDNIFGIAKDIRNIDVHTDDMRFSLEAINSKTRG